MEAAQPLVIADAACTCAAGTPPNALGDSAVISRDVAYIRVVAASSACSMQRDGGNAPAGVAAGDTALTASSDEVKAVAECIVEGTGAGGGGSGFRGGLSLDAEIWLAGETPID